MGDSDDINEFVPSLLNPRAVRKSADYNLSQLSWASRLSLSLKKRPDELSHNSQRMKIKEKQDRIRGQMVNKERRVFQDITHSQDLNTSLIIGIPHAADIPSLKKSNINKNEVLKKKTSKTQSQDSSRKHDRNELTDIEILESECSNSIESTLGCPTNKTNISDATTQLVESGTNRNSSIKYMEVSDTEGDLVIECKLKQRPPSLASLDSERKTHESKKKKTNPASDLILVLNKSAVKTYSHIVVHPPNCKFVKRKPNQGNEGVSVSPGGAKLQQLSIEPFLRDRRRKNVVGSTDKYKTSHCPESSNDHCVFVCYAGGDVNDACDYVESRMSGEGSVSPNRPSVNILASSQSGRDSASTGTRPKQTGSLPISLSTRSRVNTRHVPFLKIITGTRCAVDAFSYGDIPNVTSYFLTHFHSDQYAGLKSTFKHNLYCSKITAELCMTRLGLSHKYINIINADETHCVDGLEVTAIDANHCPGSIMLLFSLKSGKNILHCGDFRASYEMESHPSFWNKEVHTIYLDTTYCHPRYDFPSQEDCIDMAVTILQQKKKEMEDKHKKFSSVLIVCGAYTVGKEKFFLGLAASMGLAVWAAPEKDRTLQVTAGRSFSQASSRHCQIHVLPMRDITHQALKVHLDRMAGAFSEVVAFKPSAWQNRSPSPQPASNISIHSIPYSEHSSFPEMLRFIKFLQPNLVVPTVDIAGGIKTVQKYFPCPLASKEDLMQSKINHFYSPSKHTHQTAVT